MGQRGRMPKRSEERTRRNKTFEDGIELKKGEAQPFRWPRANPDWDDPTRKLYYSFKQSGMLPFLQATDVQWLWIACDELNRYRQQGKQSAMLLSSITNMFTSGMGLTEGERRRMHIELDLPAEEESDADAEKVIDLESRLKKSS